MDETLDCACARLLVRVLNANRPPSPSSLRSAGLQALSRVVAAAAHVHGRAAAAGGARSARFGDGGWRYHGASEAVVPNEISSSCVMGVLRNVGHR